MSSDNEDDFLAIDVSTDDYATTAAADQAVPEEEKDDPRTLQTEEDFRAQKASYSAKIDAGNIYTQLSTFNPPFPPPTNPSTSTSPSTTKHALVSAAEEKEDNPETKPKPKLDKKQFQLIAAAVAELYFQRDYARVVRIAEWASESFALDKRTAGAVGKWRERGGAKMEEQGKEQDG